MSAYAGSTAQFLKAASTTAKTFTNAPLVRSTDAIWQAVKNGDRFWSASNSLTVEVQTGGSGSYAANSNYTASHLAGKITFSPAINSNDNVRVSGKKFDMAKIGGAFGWSISLTGDALETTDFLSSGARTYIGGVTGWNGTADAYWIAQNQRQSYRNAAYAWTAASSGSSEYYLRTVGGANASLTEPDYFYVNSPAASKGTVGSLAAGEWGWGDNDSLGYSTAYVRLSGGGDPDAQAVDYVEATQPRQHLIGTVVVCAYVDSGANLRRYEGKAELTEDSPTEATEGVVQHSISFQGTGTLTNSNG